MSTPCENGLEDIEDIARSDKPETRQNGRKSVFPKAKKYGSSLSASNSLVADSVIPGTQKVYVKTWGCSHNNSDSEYMAGQLAAYGYTITDDSQSADLWLLNSCTVKNPAEDHFRNEITKARALKKHVVLAGCVPQGQPKSDYLQGLSSIGVQQIDRVVEVVEETLKGHTVRLFGKKKQDGRKAGGASLALPKVRKNPLIEIIAINTGCLNQCTYCKTKHARGELGSYPIEEIVNRAKQSFLEGVVEIWLTSEDLGAYGRDIGVTLPQLLWRLVDTIPEGAMLRLGMTNPPYILEHLQEMSGILSHPRVYSFLHVPVQSGSDSVLMDMKREYCVADFKHVVDFLQDKVPGVTIATDIICGFPTETDADFEETMSLVSEYKFPSLFINQFFPRPGTPAAKMRRTCTTQQVKRRTKKVSELFHSYHPYQHKLGEIQTVLVTEVSHDQQHYVGHNKFYEQVLVPQDSGLLGKMVDVEIVSTGEHYMMGAVRGGARQVGSVASRQINPPLPQGQVSGLNAAPVHTAVNTASGKLGSGREYMLWLSVALLVLAVAYRLGSLLPGIAR